MERSNLFIKGVFRRMKVIEARCNECGKTFDCYSNGKELANPSLPNCKVHTPYKKDKK